MSRDPNVGLKDLTKGSQVNLRIIYNDLLVCIYILHIGASLSSKLTFQTISVAEENDREMMLSMIDLAHATCKWDLI